MSTSSYDEERASSVEEGRVPSRTNIAQMLTSEVDPATQIDENSLSEGNFSHPNTSLDGCAPIFRSNLNTENVQPSVRRSNRSGKMPAKFNDYVVKSNVKYGLEKHIEAINNEIEALNRNNTWTITELPAGRKAIVKWVV
ncbi:hypothetical protein Tco_0054489 [Tanacetum coccineum]